MHDSCPQILRCVPRASHHRSEDEQHEGCHEDVELTRIAVRVEKRADCFVADLSKKHCAAVENDRQEAVECPRPEDGKGARHRSAIALAEGGTPVEVDPPAAIGFDDTREGCHYEPDEQERGSHESHHRKALQAPSRQQAVRNRQQETRQHVENSKYDLHLSPPFLWLEMCGFEPQ